METPGVVTPIVHMNGDRRETLIAALEAAYDVVQVARDALKQCAGNARNFYHEPGRWEQYCAQHQARMQHLGDVMDSLEAEAEAIQRQYPASRT